VCGDLDEVRRILAEQPGAAREPGGTRGWTPILYLAFTRFTHQPTTDNAVLIARLLLDNGANPNDYYMAGDAHYTVLVGVAGEGEQDSPRQPQAPALFQLMLERGAKPFDIQVLYNTHFSGDMLWWLELVYTATRKTNQAAAWDDPNWSMLDMGGYGPGAYFTLRVAVHKNDITLAEWLLSHGASPNALTSHHPRFKPKTTLYQDAQLLGFTEMCELLLRHGATPTPYVLSDKEQFIEACFRMDRDAIHAHLKKHPEYLTSPDAISAAAEKDRADVVALLLDLGTPIEVENAQKQRPLHHAAGNNALRVARLLIERGAEVDPVETGYGGTPIGWASYGDKREMIRLLSRYGRNVWTLVWVAEVTRLRELLGEKPELARLVAADGTTPLWWLPDDESKALEIVELFVSHGADPAARNKAGRTAADSALDRGMLDVARRLGVTSATGPAPAPPPPAVRTYEQLARDLLFAFESGHAGALQRLQEHYRAAVTWESLRSNVQQRLAAIPESEKPDGYFALPHAQLLVARQAGFQSWADLTGSFGR
jgi:ankyrin repeat protein